MNIVIKTIKYLIIIFLIAILMFISLEIISFSIKLNVLFKEGCFKDKTQIESIKSIWEYYSFVYKNLDDPPIALNEFRKPIIKKNNNPSVIILGCSYAYGHMLKDNETFGAVLSDYSDRTVYNWAVSSTSPRESLYLLQNQDFISKLIKDRDNVEYVIYTYIPDHIFRLYYNLAELSPIYKIKNNSELVYKKNSLYNATFLSREIQRVKYKYISDKDKQRLFALYIKSLNEEIKRNFKYKDKTTKFVILVYCDNTLIDWDSIANIDSNIIVVRISDIVKDNIFDDKYIISKDDYHPNVEAWKLIVPKMMNYLDSIEQ